MRTTPLRRLSAWVAAALAPALLLAACGGGSPSPTAVPTPTPVSGDVLISEFLALVKSPTFTVETTMSGSITSKDTLTKFTAEGKLAGNDGSMTMTLTAAGQSITFDAIFTGDSGYVRQAGGEWQEVPRSAIDSSGAQLDSFDFITDPSDLRYDGTTRYNRETVHVLANAGAIKVPGANPQDLPGSVGLLKIYVRDDGSPVFMSYRMEANPVDASNSVVRAVADIEQTFSNVGEPVTIEAPPGF